MKSWLSIIGMGENGIAGLSDAARSRVAAAELVVGGRRHLALASALIASPTLAWRSPIEATFAEIIAMRGSPVAVLASGDPFFHGVGSTLMRHVDPSEMTSLPQPSSLSLAANRLGWSMPDTVLMSLHGRPIEALRPHLGDGRRILALTSDGASAAQIAALLSGHGFGPSRFIALEALGGPDEAVREATADTQGGQATHPLTIVAIEVKALPDARRFGLAPGLPDAWFDHDGQITRGEIRAMTLSALRPQAGELLWDIGAGSGSIGIEWMLRHPSMRAACVERVAGRCRRIEANALAFGVPALNVEQGEAMMVIGRLPPPDAIFLGGGASDDQLVAALWQALRCGGRLVANAVTIEGSEALIRMARTHGGDILRLSMERMLPVGRYTAMKPLMPVVQWSAMKS